MAGNNGKLSPEDNRLLSILDELLMGVIIINPKEHRIVFVNSEAARMMNRPRSEILNRLCHDYICPAARGQCPITDLEQQIDQSERCVIDSMGQEVPIMKSVKRIQFNAEDHLLEMFLDISAVTEKERLAGVLEMAGAAAHHLSQPLQALILDLYYLADGIPDQWAKKFDEMLQSAMRMRRIIRNIQEITQYKTKEYVQGTRIVDIDGFAGPG
jgi:signal transduction histidine kinase